MFYLNKDAELTIELLQKMINHFVVKVYLGYGSSPFTYSLDEQSGLIRMDGIYGSVDYVEASNLLDKVGCHIAINYVYKRYGADHYGYQYSRYYVDEIYEVEQASTGSNGDIVVMVRRKSIIER